MRCCLSEWDLGGFWETIECWKNTLFKGEAASLCLWIAAMENVCERNQKATFSLEILFFKSGMDKINTTFEQIWLAGHQYMSTTMHQIVKFLHFVLSEIYSFFSAGNYSSK